MPIHCLIFETSLFVASYDSQGHSGGIRPRLHTGTILSSEPSGTLYSLNTDLTENIASNNVLNCCGRRFLAVGWVLLPVYLAVDLQPAIGWRR
jgi:hypothetical protein